MIVQNHTRQTTTLGQQREGPATNTRLSHDRSRNRSTGFTLIEVVAAFFLTTVVLFFVTGIFSENGRQRSAATELLRVETTASAALPLPFDGRLTTASAARPFPCAGRVPTASAALP